MPLARSRSVVPLFEPLGTVMVTGPSMVGTWTLPPSTASARLTGSSRWTLWSLRSKIACGWMWTST